MDRSFREKMLWLLFASLISVFGFYFVKVVPGGGVDTVPQHVVLFVAMVVVLVVELGSQLYLYRRGF